MNQGGKTIEELLVNYDNHHAYSIAVSEYITNVHQAIQSSEQEVSGKAIFSNLTAHEVEVVRQQQQWLKKQIESRYPFQHINYLEQSARLFFDYAVRSRKVSEEQYGELLLAGHKRLLLVREFRLRSGITEDLRQGSTDDYLPQLEDAIQSVEDRIEELDQQPEERDLQLPLDTLFVALDYQAILKSYTKIRDSYTDLAHETKQQAAALTDRLAQQRARNKHNFAQSKITLYQEKIQKITSRITKLQEFDSDKSSSQLASIARKISDSVAMYKQLKRLSEPELLKCLQCIRELEVDEELTDEVLTYAETINESDAHELLKAFLLIKTLRTSHEAVYAMINTSKHRATAVKVAESFIGS